MSVKGIQWMMLSPLLLVVAYMVVSRPAARRIEENPNTRSEIAPKAVAETQQSTSSGPVPQDFHTSCELRANGAPICPRLFVLGTQKGGTTTFYAFLESHKDFVPAMPLDGSGKRIKELSYFLKRHPSKPDDARKDLAEGYLPYFGKREYAQQWSADASPTYMYKEIAPDAFKNSGVRHNGRFIVLLRDPIQRAVSDMEKKIRGGEARTMPDSYDFAEVVNRCVPILEKCRADAKKQKGIESLGYFHCRNTVDEHTMYYGLCEPLNKGFYADALNWWLMNGFDGKHEFCILSTERFLASPQRAMRDTALGQQCLAKLGINLDDFADWDAIPDDGDFNVHNTSSKLDTVDASTVQRLETFYAESHIELVDLLSKEFGVNGFKYEWP